MPEDKIFSMFKEPTAEKKMWQQYESSCSVFEEVSTLNFNEIILRHQAQHLDAKNDYLLKK